jgi:hypothetical protein
MKKLFLLSFLITTFSYSQVIDEDGNNAVDANNSSLSGNIGIGVTPSSSSSYKLEINGDLKANKGIFVNSLPNGSVFSDALDRRLKTRILALGKEFSSAESLFNIWDVPESNLNEKSYFALIAEDRNWKSRWRFFAYAGGKSDLLYYNRNQSAFYHLSEDGSDNIHLKLPKENSYVTIGTSSYNDNGDLYKLTVNGKVRAHAMKVYTTWSDFVFEKEYALPTLEEVENYIIENGHLKDIPSAKEVEANGIELGEMNKLLLQKIEELTLYMIELKKELAEVKSQIQSHEN